MSAFQGPQPDPAAIGRLAKAPFALLPDPAALFRRRAERFEVLAAGSDLAPYLRFLAGLCARQHAIAAALPPAPPLPEARLERARAAAMPLLDRQAMADAPGLPALVAQVLEAMGDLAMPPPAAEALAALRLAEPAERAAMCRNVLADSIPTDALPEHLFLSAALQIEAARQAAALDPARLVPVGTGLCPVCGGPPLASCVTGRPGAEGARYAACGFCGTDWNEVRIKCLACGSTKGIGYRAPEDEAATIKAETCDACRSWVKILYQDRNPALDPLADDVGSLGLDLLMQGTEYRRAGFDPFLIGY
ncbi:formate dehydrogenase accessory protein FdhE [Roseicella frigidaeris]|uniref:Protein FdhE homolog n=1 Tax=Roseicella frigidaeris TaxID=2230885 RepID=A0A327M5X4_9PROT|nr:formate dehydrogenase accessory protein FdhE [Roseicella frigidaeris]RAI57776.1 formate dehydrogenase accessory protein FdhE [Roseicella frigidaeris]